jgi:hypothetical protein
MYNYQPNIDVDRSMTGVVFEAYNDYGGFQAQLNDVTFQNRVVGGLLFVKPFGFLDEDSPLLKSLSLGIEYSADYLAPKCIQASATDAHCITGGPTADRLLGNQAGPDPLTGLNRDDTFVRTDPNTNRPVATTGAVQALGFSGEMKVFATERSDIKAYATFHSFIDGGNGAALGFLGRFTTGEREVSAFRWVAELRNFGPKFLPAYFDTIYEVTKYQYFGGAQFQVTPTKYQAVFGDPAHGFVITDTSRHFGYHLEASWGLFRGIQSNKQVAVGVGLSDSSIASDTDFYAHLELPIFHFLELFASYMRLNADGPGAIFASDVSNMVVLSGLRFQILPFLFIDANYSRAFQVIKSPGAEFHLGNATVVDPATLRPSPFFSTDRIFENVQALFVELEVGAEFGGNQ